MILAALTQAPTSPAAPEPPPIRDIAPPVDVFPWPPWMVACGILLALLIVAAIVFAILRARKNRPVAPPPTPREIALSALETLRPQVDRLTPHDFSIAVSDVLRTFIGDQYRLHAREQTSPEFLAAIANSVKFSGSAKRHLATFLERCDLLKFAHIDATAGDSSELLTSASAFVQGKTE